MEVDEGASERSTEAAPRALPRRARSRPATLDTSPAVPAEPPPLPPPPDTPRADTAAAAGPSQAAEAELEAGRSRDARLGEAPEAAGGGAGM
eukprot:11002105-Alexandrium_andersonii.AAC.1